MTWLALMVSVLAATLAFVSFRQQQAYKTLLDTGRWGRRTVLFAKPRGHWIIQVRAASESTGRELWIEAGRVGGGVPDGEQATWSYEGEATALLVLDETNRVVVVPRFDTVLSLDRDNDSADR